MKYNRKNSSLNNRNVEIGNFLALTCPKISGKIEENDE
jgi:hypothetical protein